MDLVGLNGFSQLGKIGHHFTDGYFPFKFNWTRRDVNRVITGYRDYRLNPESYVAVCFSDGGTVGFPLAMTDWRCRGLIAHSASFYPKDMDQFFELRDIPILLLFTDGDIFKMDQVMVKAYEYLRDRGLKNVFIASAAPMTWHHHEFKNGIPWMVDFCQTQFNYSLPVK